jgi:hypothetical protein
MKRIAILCAALAALWAGAAWAQTVTQDGNSTRTSQQAQLQGGLLRTDSTMKANTMSSTGGQAVYDESRDRDKVRTWQPSEVLTVASLAAAAGDSSDVIDVHEYRYLKLLIKATPIGAAVNTTVRLAFQFRECMNGVDSDSSSVFPEYMYAEPPKPSERDSIAFGVVAGQARLVTFAGVDTSLAGHIVTGSVSLPWSGEYVVTFNMNRSAPGIGVAAQIFSYPNGVSIPLDSFFGRPTRFNQLQIRVRNLNITGPAVKLNVGLLGFAQ